MQPGQMEDVSDTAFMVATYRAIESWRADAPFRDPLAARLAEPHGEEIVECQPKWSAIGQRFVAMRSRIIDAFIENATAQETTTILNLGAGLDPRPYNMDRDYPKIIELRERLLSDEKPHCDLKRIKLDVSDIPARKRLLAEIAGTSGKTLVLTEGVIPYLSNEDVASLADDLGGTRSLPILARRLLVTGNGSCPETWCS